MPTTSAQQTAQKSYRLEDWEGGNQALKEEFSYPITDIDGEIPADLKGTLFRNVPAMLDVNRQEVHHPFDADGMICKITFSEGRAYFQNRYVRTKGFCEEQAAGHICYRGVFGTEKPGGWLANAFDLRLKNVANTQIIYWGGKLMALWEASHPHRIDPMTLETLGIETLDGVLHEGSPFAAHPMIDKGEGVGSPVQSTYRPSRYVSFGLQTRGLFTRLNLYELDTEAKVVKQYNHALPGFAFIHDFAITPNYCIFFQNPLSFNPVPYVLGMRGPAECMKFQKDKLTKVWMFSRHNPDDVRVFETESGFVFHHANAFEAGDDIIVDSVSYRDFPSINHKLSFHEVDFDEVPAGQLWRYRLNLKTGATNRTRIEKRSCDFPYVHPDLIGKRHQWVYLGAAHHPQGNAPNQAILKINPDTRKQEFWSAAPSGFVGEPVFVPRPGATQEDAGWVLVLVYDASYDRTDIAILDGQDLSRGAIARLHLNHHIPYGLHGCFTPEVWWPPEA